MREDHVVRQKHFYETRDHAHLRPLENDHYARKLAQRLASDLGMQPEHRVLELGAGFGRFTLPLVELCASVVAVDLSRRVHDSLARSRDARGIPVERCRPHCADVDGLTEEDFSEPFDFIVGFFLLHHLSDFAHTIKKLAPLLRPGGQMAFVEPNRFNPLFAAQVALCPDMTWREERGMFRLSPRDVEVAFRAAGLLPGRTRSFGFFPPQILNRFPSARGLEGRLERIRALKWVLPFLLPNACRPGGP